MSLLSDCELAAAQEVITDSLPELAMIARPTRVSDGAGGYTGAVAPSTVVTGVACRLDAVKFSPVERDIAGKPTAVLDWVITFPAGQDVRPQDRVTITTLNNRVFEVIGHRAGSFEVSRRVHVQEKL